MANQTPIHTIRVGKGIKATIWANKSKEGIWHSINVSRTYKDKDGKLQDSNSFSKEQAPFGEKAFALAWQYLQQLPGTDERQAEVSE